MQRESVSPNEALAAARARVAKLESALRTVGEDDETFPTLMAALKKAQSQAQERPIPDRIAPTRSFLERSEKRVEDARRAVGRAKEELAKGRGFVGEGGSFVQGWAPTIASVVGRGEGDAVAFRTTSRSKCRCGNGDQSDAGHHRQLAGRVDKIARKWGSRRRCLRRRAMMDLPYAKKARLEGGGGSKFLALTSGTEVA